MIDYNITSLPVDLLKIARESGIKVIKNSAVHELRPCESGACILINDRWIIIYDDECNVGRRRDIIAHELAHIFLGHAIVESSRGLCIATDDPKAEDAAEMFSSRISSPACVLWALDIRSAQAIAETCVTDMKIAKDRADRMRVLYKRQKFLTSPLERQVYEQFKDYIEYMKNKPSV